MRWFILICNLSALVFILGFTAIVAAQEATAVTVQPPDAKKTEKVAASAAPVDNTDKKMVREATINLQTTVTGNQEQPRVLYILPWQSPMSEDVDFESVVDNQQKAAFNHIEREELRRELEASGE